MDKSLHPLKIYQWIIPIVLLILFHHTSRAQTSTGSDKTDMDALFTMSLEQLMQVKVNTAGKIAQSIADVPASVEIIHRNDIESYGYKNLQDILENIPGLYISDEKSSFGTQINVRGYWSQTPSYVIIMINDVPQIDEVYSTYLLRNINLPVEAIERIEVIRGPISVMYGSGAFFGAINIITKSPINSGGVLASLGNNNTERAAVYLNKSENDLALSMSFLYEKADGDEFIYNDIMSDFTYYPNFDGELIPKGFGHLTKHFNIRGQYKGLYSQLTYSESDFNYQGGLPPSPDQVSEMKKMYFSGTIGLRQILNPWLKFEAQFNIYNSDFERSNIFFPFTQSEPYGYALDNAIFNDYKLDVFINPNQKMNITLGGHYKAIHQNLGRADFPVLPTSTNQSFRLHENSQSKRYSAYTQIEYKPIPKLLFYAGIRFEQDSEYIVFNHYDQGDEVNGSTYFEGHVPKGDWNVIPRIAAIYSIKQNHILKLMYGKATKSPAIASNWNVLIGNTDGSKSNDPFLKSELINTLELNYHAIINPIFSINASLFSNNLTNLIIRTRSLLPDLTYHYNVVNAGKLSSKGIEINTTTTLSSNLKIELAATYQHTKDEINPNIEVAHSPQLLAYLKAAYAFPVPDNKLNQLTISLLGRYVDHMYASWNVVKQERHGQKSKDYFLFGGHLKIDNFIMPQAFINLKTTNIFNKKYHYATSPSASWADKGMPGDGRSLLLTVGWKF